jgi:cation diffusion facilitator CzcD-associated flavoprotein CzcO
MSGNHTASDAENTSSGRPEHLDVLIIGAGLSGIAAAHYVRTDCPWASFAVLEARSALGGTWDLFRYPGIRSDSDMYTLGYSFRPWKRPEAIAEGGAILDYLNETAAEEGIDRHIRFDTKVVSADWNSADAHWTVTVEDAATGQQSALTCNFYLSCTGYYRYDHGYEPEFPGRERFAGPFVHPQHWPEDLDAAGKRVVVIGSGATAVTLVPALARLGASVTMLQRSPTYIASVPQRNPLAALLRKTLPARRQDAAIRWAIALGGQGFYRLSKRRPEVVKKILRRRLERELPPGYDVDRHFTPRYNPWDERLCAVPDGDLFAAISDGSATVVTDTIDSITSTGIALQSGAHLDADIIVSATGLDLLFLGGAQLSVDGTPVNPPDHLVYKGMMLEGVPNLAVVVGYTNASWTLKAELTCEYVARILNHLRGSGTRQCAPVNTDQTVTRQPLLGLASGYMMRAADRMPAQGSKAPWLVHQSYLGDYRAMKRSEVSDGVLQFTTPALASADRTMEHA